MSDSFWTDEAVEEAALTMLVKYAVPGGSVGAREWRAAMRASLVAVEGHAREAAAREVEAMADEAETSAERDMREWVAERLRAGVPAPEPQHNHDAHGVYPNCPACGTDFGSGCVPAPEPTTEDAEDWEDSSPMTESAEQRSLRTWTAAPEPTKGNTP